MEPAPAAIVVRRWGRWFLVERPGAMPAAAELRDLFDRFEPTMPATPHTLEVPLASDEIVAPLWAWAGELRADGVHLEDSRGDALILDRTDLQILDVLRAPVPVAELLAEAGAPLERLAFLVAAGTVRRLGGDDIRRSEPAEPRRRRPDAMQPGVDPRHPDDRQRLGRIPVYALMHAQHGVPLGLGMVTAAARHHDGGRLTETFEIRRPETAASILDDLDHRAGPAILLLSDVIWTIDDNLDVAALVVERNSEVVVVHGGPSSPRYAADIERFFREHARIAHVLARGEGERTIGELLAALGAAGGRLTHADLSGVAGIAYVDPSSGEVVRTADRPRETNLDDLPSPYLTGEFDHVVVAGQDAPFALETNRGCPYECSFCDWGSATNSRVRFFTPERVAAEVDWLASRGAEAVFVADANFGLSKRDVETARQLAEGRRRTGAFDRVYWTAAKNTTRHFVEIWRSLRAGGITSEIQIALQTTDPETLDAIGRSNISTDRLLELARLLRQETMPVRAELMIGLPGQTVESFAADLELLFEQEMALMSWTTLSLPNAPMNAPEYRSRWGIRLDDSGVVTETSTADAGDRDRMLRLRRAFLAADTYGVLRHLIRWLHQDCGVRAIQVIGDLCATAERAPDRWPAVTWLVETFDLHPLPPRGWRAFYEEIRSFVVEQYGIDPRDSALECVLRVQQALMPWPGRSFPARVDLEHDYVSYYLDVVAPLYDSLDERPVDPLVSRPPGVLEVRGDPAGLGGDGMNLWGNPRDEASSSAYTLVFDAANELDSPLLRLLPEVVRRFDPERLDQLTAQRRRWARRRTPADTTDRSIEPVDH